MPGGDGTGPAGKGPGAGKKQPYPANIILKG